MTQRLLFFATLILCSLSLPAQEWSVRYPSAYPSGYNHFHDGYVDEEDVTFLVGQEGPDKETSNAMLFRVGPDGSHSSYQYSKAGYFSKATCIVEMPGDRLFVAGNLSNDTCERLLVLIFDKTLNLLEERQYEREVDSGTIGKCRGILDAHGNVILSTYITQNNGYKGVFSRGALYKFNSQGDTIRHRYLFEAEPDPVSYLLDFKMRQMWYKEEEEETLLCLVPGFGGVIDGVDPGVEREDFQDVPLGGDA